MVEKRKERAKRFGVATKEVLIEKRQERMARFNITGGVDQGAIQARAKRFNPDSELQDEKVKREQRFAK